MIVKKPWECLKGERIKIARYHGGYINKNETKKEMHVDGELYTPQRLTPGSHVEIGRGPHAHPPTIFMRLIVAESIPADQIYMFVCDEL